MERLTFKLGNSYGLEDKASSKVGLFTDYDGFYAYLVSTNRLGAYEDTGLTPDEVIEYKKFEDGLVLKYNTPLSIAIERIEKYPQLQKEIEQLKDELKHAYDKSNTAVKGYYELKQSYEQLQKENAELKELLKLAVEDIRGIVTGMEECELCKNNDVGENIKYCHKHDFDCKNCEVLQDCKCGQCKGTNNWQWQHTDKLKELGVEI